MGEIGVLKTLGMTPWQVLASVVASMAAIGLAALGTLVPAGWAARTRIATALRAE